MSRLIALRFVLLTLFVAVVFLNIRNLQPVDLPDPPGIPTRTEGCRVDSEDAKIHEKHENAYVQFVNDDNTVQVQTTDSKLALLFKVKPSQFICFRKGSIVPVTIVECDKDKNARCDFSLPHSIFVRTLPVKVVAWKYVG